jgi:NADH dehydrogenase
MINQDDRNIVTVFGATGFLGRRIVTRLLERGVNIRAASRHPHRLRGNASGKRRSHPIEADILDPSSIAAAVAGTRAVVNAAASMSNAMSRPLSVSM